MTEDIAKPILVGMTRGELEDKLASAFEYHRGRGYFHNDANYDDPTSYVIMTNFFLVLMTSKEELSKIKLMPRCPNLVSTESWIRVVVMQIL